MASSSKTLKLKGGQLRLIYDEFRLVDEDRDGFIDQNQHATLIRALGQTVSDYEISRRWKLAAEEQLKRTQIEIEEVKRLSASASGSAKEDEKGVVRQSKHRPLAAPASPPPDTINFQTFVNIFTKTYTPPESEKTLMEAFQLFDKANSGKLSVQQLQNIVSSRGEPLPKAEFEELLLVADLDGQKNFDYTRLAKRLLEGPAGVETISMHSES